MTQQDLKLVPEKSGSYNQAYTTPYGDWTFNVRADGCVEIKRFFNGSSEDTPDNEDMDCLHVCDFDAFAETVRVLAEQTKEFRESL